jgi:hypothetical protein
MTPRPYTRLRDVDIKSGFQIGSVAVTATAAELNLLDDATTAIGKLTSMAAAAYPVVSQEVTFTENGAGTYTGSVTVPASATVLDIIVEGTVLWAAATSALMDVGDAEDPDGYFTQIDLKATDLTADQTINFTHQGGKAGAYNVGTNTHWTNRYQATARVVSGVVVSVGTGTAGRTRMTVVYSMPSTSTAATKA